MRGCGVFPGMTTTTTALAIIDTRQYSSSDEARIQHAAWLAMRAHRGQVDKAGVPYIAHVLQVGATLMFRSQPTRVVVAGFLHDVIEDTDATLDGLRGWGVGEKALKIVEVMTRRKGESYDQYITRIIAGGSGPIAVKMADVDDHLARSNALSLIHAMPAGSIGAMKERYIKARNRLVVAGFQLGMGMVQPGRDKTA